MKYFIVIVVFATWTRVAEGAGTLKPVLDADLKKDATELNNALGAWNANQETFLKILPYRTCKQRKEIYNQMSEGQRDSSTYYNESDGDICITVMHSFLCETVEYYRTWICYGMRTTPYMDTKMLMELLILLSFEEESIKKDVLAEDQWVEFWVAGQKVRLKSPSLLDEWTEYVGDDFGNWGCEMLKRTGNTDKTTNLEAAKADAAALIEEMKTDFDDHRLKLDEILAERSAEQAVIVMDEFKKANHDTDLADVIKHQLGGDIKDAYLHLITYIREGRANYLAIRLKVFMDGVGTNDINLSRLIVHASEIDLVEIRNAYQQKYYSEQPLRSRIKDDTSGFTRDFLFGFLGESP